MIIDAAKEARMLILISSMYNRVLSNVAGCSDVVMVSKGNAELHSMSRTLAKISNIQCLADAFDGDLEYDLQLLRINFCHRLAGAGLSEVGESGGLVDCKKLSGVCVGDPRGDNNVGDAGSSDCCT